MWLLHLGLQAFLQVHGQAPTKFGFLHSWHGRGWERNLGKSSFWCNSREHGDDGRWHHYYCQGSNIFVSFQSFLEHFIPLLLKNSVPWAHYFKCVYIYDFLEIVFLGLLVLGMFTFFVLTIFSFTFKAFCAWYIYFVLGWDLLTFTSLCKYVWMMNMLQLTRESRINYCRCILVVNQWRFELCINNTFKS